MDTHEFQFPGGSAVITTTTGGTRHNAAQIFAAEILKLAGKVEELESALAAAGEERENMENRLSGRIAELEAEIERRAAENIAVQDKSRSVTETLLAVAALFKGTPEAKIAKLEAENVRLAERVRELEDESPGTGLPASRLCFILNRLHEIFPDMAVVRVKARPAELAYLERIAGLAKENAALNDMVRARQDTINHLRIRLDMAKEAQRFISDAWRKKAEEQAAEIAGLRTDNLSLVNSLEGEGAMNEQLRADLAAAIRTREEQEVPRETDAAEEPPPVVTIGEVEEWRRRIARHGAGISDLDASDKPNLEISVIAREIPKQPIADAEGERKRLEEENAAMRTILREVEFEGEGDTCPSCGFSNPKHRPDSPGHDSNCRLCRVLEGKAVHQDTLESENATLRKLVDIASREIDRLAAQKTAAPDTDEKAKILNYLENCARVSQPVLAWHFRNAKAEIGRGAHLEDSFTFSLPPYEVVKEQEAAEATVREALDDIVEKKLHQESNPAYVHQEGAHLGRWISAEEVKEHWPDSSEPIRTQPVVEGALRTEPGVVVAASPGSLAAEYAAERGMHAKKAFANRVEAAQTKPWFAGLSMEEVHMQILLGKAPGSGQPGAAISVPEGFLNWLTDAHRQPGPEKAEEPRFKPLGVGGPGAWEARRRRHAASDLRIKVADEVERLAKLLAEPHSGLASWNEACERSYQRLRKLFHGSSEEPHGE